MKKYTSDRDGKSKTASAVDQQHYPEQHEVENQDIEATQDKDEKEPQAAKNSRGEVQGTVRPSGSVQR